MLPFERAKAIKCCLELSVELSEQFHFGPRKSALLRAAHEEVQRTHEFGRFQDICEDTVAKVKKLAQMFEAGLVETYQAWLLKKARP